MSIIVKTEPKIIFLHIPKTAGTSIANWMINTYGVNAEKIPDHPTLSKLFLLTNNEGTSFTVVRNPYDIVVSAYEYFRQYGDNSMKKVSSDFKKFVLFIERRVLNYKGSQRQMVLPQQSFYIDNPIDLILRYENLKEDFVKIQNLCKSNLSLPVLRSTSRKDYRFYYDDISRSIISRLYQEDLDQFKYIF